MFIAAKDGLNRPLTVLHGVVFQHDDIAQVDDSLLDEDPMMVCWLPIDLNGGNSNTNGCMNQHFENPKNDRNTVQGFSKVLPIFYITVKPH